MHETVSRKYFKLQKDMKSIAAMPVLLSKQKDSFSWTKEPYLKLVPRKKKIVAL